MTLDLLIGVLQKVVDPVEELLEIETVEVLTVLLSDSIIAPVVETLADEPDPVEVLVAPRLVDVLPIDVVPVLDVVPSRPLTVVDSVACVLTDDGVLAELRDVTGALDEDE